MHTGSLRQRATLVLSIGMVGCGLGEPVVGGRLDAQSANPFDAPEAATFDGAPTPDLPVEVGADSSLDATDAAEAGDAADDRPPMRCTANSDCATDPGGRVCDLASGRCVECLPSADTCAPDRHCDAVMLRCVPGCRSDEGCAAPTPRCDTAGHACVACVTDAHCPAGSLCVGNRCAPGCNPAQPCPSAQSCCAGSCVDITGNTLHCGGCSMACALPQAMASCVMGRCAVASCADGRGDCDRDPANGCEVDTGTSLSHCGACGAACATPDGTPSCVAGRCTVGACNAGRGDCDAMPANGCETALQTSDAHCGRCGNACAAGTFCFGGACVRDNGRCTSDDQCPNDSRCDTALGRCVPNGPGARNTACSRTLRPGVFNPAIQCAYGTAPAGDAFPDRTDVISTPMVLDLNLYRASGAPARPAIVAIFESPATGGSDVSPTGVLRIIDGRTCALLDTIGPPLLERVSIPAVADLNGDGPPEIVAFAGGGGLVAFRFDVPTMRWTQYWRATLTDGRTTDTDNRGVLAGPTVVDIDDDGRPEVLRHGMVYNGQTGVRIGGSFDLGLGFNSYGGFPPVLDVDEDGAVELVTGTGLYAWNPTTSAWERETYSTRSNCTGAGCGDGITAVANFGAYTTTRFADPALPEIAVVSLGYVRVDTLEGRTVFGPVRTAGGGLGGPPTVADLDGDGQVEIAVGDSTAYAVYDPDCASPAPTQRPGGRCGTSRTTGVLWSTRSQDTSSQVTGSTTFDFEGDGSVEAVYADECFLRVYDGRTGDVVASYPHASCTAYEQPTVADVDADGRAEIVLPSNRNCGITCSGLGPRNTDPMFAGRRCGRNADCVSGACDMGFCRCTVDAECCAPGAAECTSVCVAPPAGTPGTGNTCRTARDATRFGIRVLGDAFDNWVPARPVWTQGVFHVANIDDNGRVPRTRDVRRNWRVPGLNHFRTNIPGVNNVQGSADVTSSAALGACAPAGVTVSATTCNRGAVNLPDGIAVGFYDGNPSPGPAPRICRVVTTRALAPGECETLSCVWAGVPRDMPRTVYFRGDDDGLIAECAEGNNGGTIPGVVCRP
jgi:hypothetical protein